MAVLPHPQPGREPHDGRHVPRRRDRRPLPRRLHGDGLDTGGTAGVGSFTVTRTAGTTVTTGAATTGTTSISLGPLSLQGPTVGLAGTSFSKGILDLTIQIGVADASLSFGSGGSSGFSADLHGIVGTFDVQVNLLTALQHLTDPAGLLSAFSVPGTFSLSVQSLTMTVPNAVTITASGIHVNYNPTKDQSFSAATPFPLVTVDTATVTFPSFGVGADIQKVGSTPGLTIYSDGFFLGQADLIFAPANGIDFAGLLHFTDLRIGVQNFGMTFDNGGVQFHGGPDGSSGIVISSGGVQFLPGKAVNGMITDGPDPGTVAVSATFTFDSSGNFKSFQFNADQLTINLGSFLTLTASNFNIDTGADANHPLVSFASVGAKLTVGGLVISGEARNFSFNGDGSFHAGNGFGVFLSVGAATGDSFMWPSWLPIQIDAIGITWPDIQADPTNFVLTLSASVTGIQGIGGLTFSGSIQGIQIDVGKLLAGEFPIVGLSSIGVEVKGNVFGGQLDAALIGGILKVDAAGNLIADTDTTTPVAQRVFFAGLQGGFSLAGMGGFTIRLALSDLGPLTVFISATLPTGILLEPTTGLTLNNFAGGVEFFHTLPSIDDPLALRDAAFAAPTNITVDNWLSTVKAQVVAQVQALKANPSESGWAAAFSAPMTITGSATIYSIYTSQQLFNGAVTVEISTDGKILVIGTLNFADNNLSVSGRLYIDLSQISSGAATVLFLADVPDQVRVLTLYGKLQMGFKNSQGDEVTFSLPDEAPTSPTATLGGPTNGGTISEGELNGRGFIDVSYLVGANEQLDDSSITDLAPEFTLSAASGSIALDSTQAPVLIDPTTHTYRYWVVSDNATGITLTPIDSSWALDDTTTGIVSANPMTAAAAFDVRHVARGDAVHRRRARPDRGPDRRRLEPRHHRLHLLAGRHAALLDPDRLARPDADAGHAGLPLLPHRHLPARTDRRQLRGRRLERHRRSQHRLERLVHGRLAGDDGRGPVQRLLADLPGGTGNLRHDRRRGRECRHRRCLRAALRRPDLHAASGSDARLHLHLRHRQRPDAHRRRHADHPRDADPDLDGRRPGDRHPHGDADRRPPGRRWCPLGRRPADAADRERDALPLRLLGLVGGRELVAGDRDDQARPDEQHRRGSATAPAAADLDFEVLGPTADLVSPTNGSGIDVNTLNGRSYVDVTLPAPPTGYTIDWSAITSTTPIFTFSGPGAGTAAVDPTQAPIVLDQTARTVRYWTTGSFASGDVTAVFVPGGPPLTETALGTVHDDGPVAIDVTFVGIPVGDVIDPNTVAFSATHTPFVLDPTATGLGSVTINPTVAPIVLADGKTVRYAVSGSFAAGGTVTVTFNRGTWSVKPLGGGASTVDTGTGTTQVTLGTVPSAAGSYPSFAVEGESLDVVFPAPVGDTISAASLSGAGQVTLGGAVLAPTSIDVIFPVATGFVLDPTTLTAGGKFTPGGARRLGPRHRGRDRHERRPAGARRRRHRPLRRHRPVRRGRRRADRELQSRHLARAAGCRRHLDRGPGERHHAGHPRHGRRRGAPELRKRRRDDRHERGSATPPRAARRFATG